ncbi:MAG: phosphoribosylformylglycinamidine cyclo-ligase [Deltaproteobacteria bacterium]|nr:phosphoribosylformylglycinamidine cyclo-ligase [Deltaproteobacteria bacterium]
MKKPLTYADAGVDIDKGNALVGQIKKIARSTFKSNVLSDIGGFGSMYSLNLDNFKRPVLVSSTDGVGTKLKIAFLTGKHDTIGIDLVAMCVNDIAVQGAKPLFFLDYISMGKLDNTTAMAIISGIGDGCKLAGCALIGGETAEMPGLYQENEYDLAGFTVGIVDNDKIIDGSDIRVGNQLIGIASSGLHSNGYSLVRKICFEVLKMDLEEHLPELGKTLAEELLTPTKIYTETLLSIARDLPINGLSHITGGGFEDNLVRIIPEACGIEIKKDSWEIPPIFTFLKEAGGIEDREMKRTFNNGLGMIAIVPENAAQDVFERINAMNEKAYFIGEIVERKTGTDRIVWV